MTFYGMSSETAMNKHSGGVAQYRAAEGKTRRDALSRRRSITRWARSWAACAR